MSPEQPAPPTSRPSGSRHPRMRPRRDSLPSETAPARGVLTPCVPPAAEGASRAGRMGGRGGDLPHGLARVSVGPCARGGQESGPRCVPPPGVSPAVGGAPWRLAGGSRGGRGRIGGGVDVAGAAGRTGGDCALLPYIRKASRTLPSGSRELVCELVSRS